MLVSDPPTNVSAIISAWSSLSVRQRPHSGIRRVDHVGQQGVVGLAAEPLEDRLEVVLGLDLHLGRPDRFLVGLHHPEPLDPGVGPRLDLPDVLLRCAHLLADDDQRQRDGELADPVAAPLVDEVVDQSVGQVLDEGVELA